MRWVYWINVGLGVILSILPFASRYGIDNQVAAYEGMTVGLLIMAMAMWSVLDYDSSVFGDYAQMLLGLWSIGAPFALGYGAAAGAGKVDIVAGMLALVIAAVGHFSHAPTMRAHVVH